MNLSWLMMLMLIFGVIKRFSRVTTFTTLSSGISRIAFKAADRETEREIQILILEIQNQGNKLYYKPMLRIIIFLCVYRFADLV